MLQRPGTGSRPQPARWLRQLFRCRRSVGMLTMTSQHAASNAQEAAISCFGRPAQIPSCRLPARQSGTPSAPSAARPAIAGALVGSQACRSDPIPQGSRPLDKPRYRRGESSLPTSKLPRRPKLYATFACFSTFSGSSCATLDRFPVHRGSHPGRPRHCRAAS